MARTVTPASERLWARVDKTETCWNWTGSLHRSGYGLMGGNADGRKITLRVHRVAFAAVNGEIPEGMQVDHVCHNRACVNPAHLRLTTHKENQENRSGPRRDCKSGVRGVYESRGQWAAEVRHHGKRIYLGRFSTLPSAEAAVVAKRNELFTHNDIDRAA